MRVHACIAVPCCAAIGDTVQRNAVQGLHTSLHRLPELASQAPQLLQLPTPCDGGADRRRHELPHKRHAGARSGTLQNSERIHNVRRCARRVRILPTNSRQRRRNDMS